MQLGNGVTKGRLITAFLRWRRRRNGQITGVGHRGLRPGSTALVHGLIERHLIAGLPFRLRRPRVSGEPSVLWAAAGICKRMGSRLWINARHGSLNTKTTGCCTSFPTVGLGYRSLEMIIRAHICQRLVKRPENKIVNQAPIAETHFVLGGVNIHVHVRGINLQIQHERRVAVVV